MKLPNLIVQSGSEIQRNLVTCQRSHKEVHGAEPVPSELVQAYNHKPAQLLRLYPEAEGSKK